MRRATAHADQRGSRVWLSRVCASVVCVLCWPIAVCERVYTSRTIRARIRHRAYAAHRVGATLMRSNVHNLGLLPATRS